jgi:[ribosomal protein S5]-alanine N-acetyltransferase
MLGGYASDPAVTRYLTWNEHPSLDGITQHLKTAIAEWESGTSFRYELCYVETKESVGSIRLRPEKTSVLLSFVLARPFWGRGLMSETLKFVLDWIFAQPDLYRAYAFCDIENAGSIRVMEKAGMSCEGTLRRWHVCPNISLEPRDCFIFAKVK